MLSAALAESYRYREVLYHLLARDLKVKYKRTALGYLWSLLNPVLQLAVMAVVFSHIVGREMENYTHFLFSGLLAWNFFQTSLISASRSLLEAEGFIKKVYLPKAIFPLSKLCLRAIDFLFALVALSIIGAVAGFVFHPTAVLLPLVVILFFFFTLGISLFVSVATVYFRDIEYLLTVVLQLLYFATPVLYPVTALPAHYHPFLKLNPLYSLIDLFQKTLYFGVWPSALDWSTAILLTAASMTLGLVVLLRLEEDLVFRL